jgi:glucan-binding YG repeat protein
MVDMSSLTRKALALALTGAMAVCAVPALPAQAPETRLEAQASGIWRQGSDGRWWFDLGDGDYLWGDRYTIGGTDYVFDDNGWMYAGGWAPVHGWNGTAWYYVDGAGVVQTGWLSLTEGWFYLDPSRGGAMRTGWMQNSDGRYYYFFSSGVMATGWQYLGNDSGSAWYYFDYSGLSCSGWMWDGSYWYYLSTSDDHLVSGLAQVGGSWYLFCDEYGGSVPFGAMRTGWFVDPARSDDSYIAYMYFGDDGARRSSCEVEGYAIDAEGYYYHPRG